MNQRKITVNLIWANVFGVILFLVVLKKKQGCTIIGAAPEICMRSGGRSAYLRTGFHFIECGGHAE